MIWKWDWIGSQTPEQTPEEKSASEDQCSGSDTVDNSIGEEEEDMNETTLFTVRFKCVGVTRDQTYQEVLEKAISSWE